MTLPDLTPPTLTTTSSDQRRRTIATSAKTLAASLLVAISTSATPVSADTACDTYKPSCSAELCECGHCGSSHSFQNTPLYQTLDTVAGGIERLFGLDRCKTHCDQGCDSAPYLIPIQADMPPMVVPHPPVAPQPVQPTAPTTAAPTTAPPTTAAPTTAPPAPLPKPVETTPQLPAVPPLDSRPTAPKMSEPRIVTPEATPPSLPTLPEEPSTEPEPGQQEPGQPESETSEPQIVNPDDAEMSAPRLVPVQPNPVAPSEASPLRLPETTPEPATEPKEEGSIFDALDDLDDPFLEDAARLKRQYGVIPTSELRTAKQIPAYRPVRPPQQTSPRPLPTQQPIGSGLRPVSHEEPVQLRPMGSRRVLAPYRPSRS